MRRGGTRREVTERVSLKGEDGRALEGWALNVSRGGLRIILEEKVSLRQRFDVVVGTNEVIHRLSRVVWVQEEPDGVIVGLEFTPASSAPNTSAATSNEHAGERRDVNPRGDASDE